MLFLALPLWTNIIITVIMVLVLSGLFVVQRKWIATRQDTIRNWQVWLLYLLDLVILAGFVVIGLLIWGVDLMQFANAMWNDIQEYIIDRIAAIIGSVVIIFVMLAILKVSKLALFHIGKKDGPLQKRKKTIAKVTQSIIKYVVGIISILAILALWGVNVLPALAGLGIAGLVIGLGAQKFINDLISGFFIIFEHHFDVGDIIEVGGYKGEVMDIGLKTTRIKGWRGDIKIMANGEITNLINYSRNPSVAIVDFGIAYKEDIDKTIGLLKVELPKLRMTVPEMIEDPQVLGVMNLGTSSIDMRVICKTMTEMHYGVERIIRQRIKEILEENGIEIPFPQLVVTQARTE